MARTTTASRIAALEEAIFLLRRELDTDPLTELGNRRLLSRRATDGEGWYVFADLDGFKAAQDGHPDGHAHGDRILREFADFLRSVVREDEDQLSYRLGGDEFLVRVASKAGARRVRDAIREWRSGEDTRVTASAGMGRDVEAADAAMYIAKQRK